MFACICLPFFKRRFFFDKRQRNVRQQTKVCKHAAKWQKCLKILCDGVDWFTLITPTPRWETVVWRLFTYDLIQTFR